MEKRKGNNLDNNYSLAQVQMSSSDHPDSRQFVKELFDVNLN